MPRTRAAAPTQACIEPRSIAITVGAAREGGYMRQVPAGLLGAQLWHGGAGISCLFFFQAPTTRQDVVERRGSCATARVGIIMAVPDAARRPVMFDLFYDPTSAAWWIDGVSVTNFDPTGGARPCAAY